MVLLKLVIAASYGRECRIFDYDKLKGNFQVAALGALWLESMFQ